MGEQFPIFRLGALLAKQLSTPIAKRIKSYATSHPWFSRAVCGGAARLYVWAETQTVRAALSASGSSLVRLTPPPLSARRAQDMGGDIIGEVIVFVLGAAILVFEVNRQAMIKEEKEAEKRSCWLALRLSLEELRHEAALQENEMRRLRDVIEAHRRGPPSADPGPPASGPE